MKALVRNSTGKAISVKRSGPFSEPPDSEKIEIFCAHSQSGLLPFCQFLLSCPRLLLVSLLSFYLCFAYLLYPLFCPFVIIFVFFIIASMTLLKAANEMKTKHPDLRATVLLVSKVRIVCMLPFVIHSKTSWTTWGQCRKTWESTELLIPRFCSALFYFRLANFRNVAPKIFSKFFQRIFAVNSLALFPGISGTPKNMNAQNCRRGKFWRCSKRRGVGVEPPSRF